jgi:hypothetical protein
MDRREGRSCVARVDRMDLHTDLSALPPMGLGIRGPDEDVLARITCRGVRRLGSNDELTDEDSHERWHLPTNKTISSRHPRFRYDHRDLGHRVVSSLGQGGRTRRAVLPCGNATLGSRPVRPANKRDASKSGECADPTEPSDDAIAIHPSPPPLPGLPRSGSFGVGNFGGNILSSSQLHNR